jgi:hypothetical protein
MRLATVDRPVLPRVPLLLDPLTFDERPDPACAHLNMMPDMNGIEAQELCARFALHHITGTCTSDFARATTLCTWVHSRWRHISNNPAKTDSAVEILDRAAVGERFRCAEYGFVLGRVLGAVGMPSRSIGLRTLDVETRAQYAGHVGTEVFLPDMQRWVFLDPQFDLVALSGDQPLTAVELQHAFARGNAVSFRTSLGLTSVDYRAFIEPYLAFFDVLARERSGIGQMWNVSLVANGLDAPQAFEGTPYTGARRVATRSLSTFYPKSVTV